MGDDYLGLAEATANAITKIANDRHEAKERMLRALSAGAVLSGGCVAVSRVELERLRSATRVRVTAEEPPTGEVDVLTWPVFLKHAIVAEAHLVASAPKMYPHWLPLPRREQG